MHMSKIELFRKKWVGGLDPDQVQDYIDKVVQERREYQNRVSQLETRLSELQVRIKGYEEKEKAMKDTVEMVDAYSRKIDKEAQERKTQVLESASKEARAIIDRATEKRALVEKEILRLQKQKQVILSDIKGVCNRHLSLIRAETVEHDSLSLLDEDTSLPAESNN